MKEISIFGCGWLGFPLAKQLIQDGYTIKGSTTTPAKVSALKESGIQPYLIEKGKEGLEATDFFDCDILIINIPPRNIPGDADFHRNNMEAVAARIDWEKTKVLFISSTAVYPANNSGVAEQNASVDCLSRGGVSLISIEEIFRKDPKTTVLRLAGLYGPDRHPGRFLSGKKIGGRDNPVNMIHLEDCIGVIRSILSLELWGKVYNACSPNHPTKEAFYEQASQELGVAPPVFTEEKVDYKVVHSNKLITDTNYHFTH